MVSFVGIMAAEAILIPCEWCNKSVNIDLYEMHQRTHHAHVPMPGADCQHCSQPVLAIFMEYHIPSTQCERKGCGNRISLCAFNKHEQEHMADDGQRLAQLLQEKEVEEKEAEEKEAAEEYERRREAEDARRRHEAEDARRRRVDVIALLGAADPAEDEHVMIGTKMINHYLTQILNGRQFRSSISPGEYLRSVCLFIDEQKDLCIKMGRMGFMPQGPIRPGRAKVGAEVGSEAGAEAGVEAGAKADHDRFGNIMVNQLLQLIVRNECYVPEISPARYIWYLCSFINMQSKLCVAMGHYQFVPFKDFSFVLGGELMAVSDKCAAFLAKRQESQNFSKTSDDNSKKKDEQTKHLLKKLVKDQPFFCSIDDEHDNPVCVVCDSPAVHDIVHREQSSDKHNFFMCTSCAQEMIDKRLYAGGDAEHIACPVCRKRLLLFPLVVDHV